MRQSVHWGHKMGVPTGAWCLLSSDSWYTIIDRLRAMSSPRGMAPSRTHSQFSSIVPTPRADVDCRHARCARPSRPSFSTRMWDKKVFDCTLPEPERYPTLPRPQLPPSSPVMARVRALVPARPPAQKSPFVPCIREPPNLSSAATLR